MSPMGRTAAAIMHQYVNVAKLLLNFQPTFVLVHLSKLPLYVRQMHLENTWRDVVLLESSSFGQNASGFEFTRNKKLHRQ